MGDETNAARLVKKLTAQDIKVIDRGKRFASSPKSTENVLAEINDKIGGGTTSDELFASSASVALLDAVYVDSTNHVDRADATSQATMPIIGFAVKVDAGGWYVRYVGKVSGFIAKTGGLVSGAKYWVDPATPGGIVTPMPSGSGIVLQSIGTAKNTDELILQIDEVITTQ